MLDKDLLNQETSLIQDIIKRLANNSFLIKGWTLTLVSIILVVIREQNTETNILSILLFPVIAFWILDAYFLRKEKQYRKLYDWVVDARLKGNNEFAYKLNSERFKNEVPSIVRTIFSNTLTIFYSIPLLVILSLILNIILL